MKFILVAVGAMIASPALAMPATTFLAKADALMAKGPMALFSKDIGLLKAEGARVGNELKAERLALVAQRKSASYCPPPKSSLSSDELIKGMRRIPKTELAKMQFKDAMRRVLEQKFPC